jgi:hypothetical protein
MVWVGLLLLMLVVAAAPGISIYVEHLRDDAAETAEPRADGQQPAA